MPKLSKIDRNILQNYLKWRERRPTVARIFALALPQNLLRLVMLLAMLAGGLWLLLPTADELLLIGMGCLFAGGMLVGAWVNWLAIARYTVRFWPLLESLLDWAKVDRYLADDGWADQGQHSAASPPATTPGRARETGNPFQSPGA